MARELARYNLVLVGIQGVIWGEGCTLRAGDYIFLHGEGKENHKLRTVILYNTEQYQQLRE